MFRRRRPRREVEFSFDSFLDVVANVVGIILRLIMVAWVAARGYQALVPPPPPLPELTEPEAPPGPSDPREGLLAGWRAEVEREEATAARASARRGPDLEALRREVAAVARAVEAATSRHRAAEEKARRERAEAGKALASAEEVRRRARALLEEVERLRKLPSLKKTLRYHTPVSAELQSEEAMFELRAGRVTLIDTQALVRKASAEARARADELRNAWEVTGVTPAVGAFRLKYTVERERTAEDGVLGGGPVGGSYRYGLSAWQLSPVDEKRGEDAEAALREGSAFRRVIDSLSPKQTAVTLWVYDDSFPLYRKLRDYLHEREFVVAGRPLPAGMPIGSSRHGTASRGQ
jgi:hypothetical protein